VDDALGTDALALAVKAEVKDLLVRVLSTRLFIRNPAQQQVRCASCIPRVRMVPHGLPLVRLFLSAICRQLGSLGLAHSLRAFVWLPWFCIRFGCSFGSRYDFLKFGNTLCVEGGAFVADFADYALSDELMTLAGFFFFISKARRSEAQSRQRSWLQESMSMSSGSFLHLVQG